MTEKTITYEGNYWWGDSQNVTSVLEKELKKVLSKTRVSSIEICGCDFNDGRENHRIEIKVNQNEIIVKKIGGSQD